MNIASNTYKLILLGFIFSIFTSCSDDDDTTSIDEDHSVSFLTDIKPTYFENVNYESESVVSQIPVYLDEMSISYNKVEQQYLDGYFTTPEDIAKIRIVNYYYSFYLISLVGGYLDGFLSMEDITGSERTTGYFSNVDVNSPNYAESEIQSMAERALNITLENLKVGDYNDKSYGFYITVNQLYQRAINNNMTSSESNKETVDFASIQLVDFNVIPNWNTLMTMITFTNYEDPLNTFQNPKMEDLLFTVNSRITPFNLENLDGLYPEIFGPIYRFDLNLKKVDFVLQNSENKLNENEIMAIKRHIGYMETVSDAVSNDRADLLDSWADNNTFEERLQKLEELKLYINNTDSQEKPNFTGYLNTVNFKKAYQCYSCHASSELLDY